MRRPSFFKNFGIVINFLNKLKLKTYEFPHRKTRYVNHPKYR
ncbi:hypothetical protein LEP1GSC186_3819 [Leptospira noguchii serovar Autumnalis str. ZUN142]|uniref:Uncharacterized protein n=1 Tax=Leptospira noguchii serovar Autumnalis str. ZUN142 TaxID=1085540 RepID=M6UFB5_9LEPT|nr:hypothetical protein LEP1GSC186_3819 [Leptospira noguchii serovar Autumnalis str. ZUN142]